LLAVVAPKQEFNILSQALKLIGTIAVFAAIAGRAWSLLYVGGRKNVNLVVRGPYSTTRNPLYFFSLVGIAGASAQSGSLLIVAAVTAFSYFAFDMAIRGEETYLAERHGAAFDLYRMATPRLLPRASLRKESKRTPLQSAVALRSLKDGLVFVVAWAGVGLLSLGQSTAILPVLWTLPL